MWVGLIAFHMQNESAALRKMIIAKQTSKSGRKRERKAAKALQMLKVCLLSVIVIGHLALLS